MNLSHLECLSCGHKGNEIQFINIDGHYQCPVCGSHNLSIDYSHPEYTPGDFDPNYDL